MTTEEKILGIILTALESLNEELPEADRVALSADTPLFGDDATLDSLSLVSVIVDVETALTMEFDQPVALTDDRAMSREVSPFTHVQALADYIMELVSEMQQA